MDPMRTPDIRDARRNVAKNARQRLAGLSLRETARTAYVLGAVLAATAYVFLTDRDARDDLIAIFK